MLDGGSTKVSCPRSFKARQFAMVDTEDGVNFHFVCEPDNRRLVVSVYSNMADLVEVECLKRKKANYKSD